MEECVVDVNDYESWPSLSKTVSTDSPKMNATDPSSKTKSVGEVCKFCQKTFMRLKSHKCKVKVPDTITKVSEKVSEKCLGCQKEFMRITKHLSSSLDCQQHYNMNDLKTKSSDANRKRRSREIMTDNEKAIELAINREREKKRRESMNEEQKAHQLAQGRERERRRRANMNTEEKKDQLAKGRERERRRRANMTIEEKIKLRIPWAKWTAKSKAKRYKMKNNSIFMRKRQFIEMVRDGPIYPCISCHRILYHNAVILIKNLNEFKEKINKITDNLFDEVIGPDEMKIPNLQKKYYLCQTCRNYIFKGKMPPISNQNNLETFNYKEYPELQLTELETSMIAKNILFMKIFKLPKSRMSAIKDRTVCVPIDDTTIENTMLSLPRTPNEANLLPVKLKRKKSFKGSHLEEYINVSKIFKTLSTLKKLGHGEYQYYEEKDKSEFQSLCLNEDNQVSNELFNDNSDEDEEEETDQNSR